MRPLNVIRSLAMVAMALLAPPSLVTAFAAGPAQIRYAASVKDGVWTEIGERILAGQPPVKIFEMQLQRVGGTDWPASGALGP